MTSPQQLLAGGTSFALFNDTSEMRFKGIPISLNVIATKTDKQST